MTKGRKRKAGRREPNGRLSRRAVETARRNLADMDREQRDALAVGLEARERVFGIKPQHSRDQKAGSAIGRYCLVGLVTQAQYDAAMLFVEARARYLLAIDAPPQPGAVDPNAARGRPVGTENPTQLRKWREEYREATAAIQEKQNEIRGMGNLFGSLGAMLFRDVMLDHLLGDARIALNALVRHYGLLARAA